MNLDSLNDKQKEAVKYIDGPLLVLAGAGSGKTKVLTSKIAYLLEEKDVYSREILAITFTNKAAKEMKNRIYDLVGTNSHGLWMGTFHSISVRILRQHADLIGYGKDFVIYDAMDQKSIIKDCMKELDISTERFPVKMVISKISKAKDEMISPLEYKNVFVNDFLIDEIYDLYEKKMFKNNGMDFDNIILNLNKLFKLNKDIIEFYRKSFKYVLVDEYQDTNKAQYEMISLLTKGKGNLFVVGDNDQSIYGWRGADIRNITEFEHDFKGAKVIKLEQNYRSTKNILDVANAVISNNRYRKDKNLWSAEENGNLINLFNAYDEYNEADFVITSIYNLTNAEYRTKDIAILYRTNAQSRNFEDRLRRYDIPYRLVGGTKFYSRKEVKDMLAYLRVVQNPLDEVSLVRIINEPKRGIGKRTIEKIKENAIENDISFYDAMFVLSKENKLSAKATKKLGEFLSVIKKYIDKKDEMKSQEILMGIFKDSGYENMLVLENTIESNTRIENINELLNAVYEYSENEDDYSLEGFLCSVSLMSDVDGMDDEEIGVTLMTLHSAKGLEFPVVFLVGMEEGLFPNGRAFDSPREMEEERRLCYVGITRAKKEVYLSYASKRKVFGEEKTNIASRFIKEIPSKYINDLNPKPKFMRKESKRQEKKDDFYSEYIRTKNRKKKEKVNIDNELDKFVVGTKVKHEIFGIGTIVGSNGDDGKKVSIAFENLGIKNLHLDYAPLNIVK